jgi:predicted permease
VGGEVALCAVLLVAAGLLGHSLVRLTAVDPGFDASGVLLVRVHLPQDRYPGPAAGEAFIAEVTARVRAVPGVLAVSGGTPIPFSGDDASSSVRVEGMPEDAPSHELRRRIVLPGYFGTLGIPLIAGRDFTEQDRTGGQDVAIVSEAAVRRLWPGQHVVGRRLEYDRRSRTVVGVAGDVRHASLNQEPEATFYVPWSQLPAETFSFLVRVQGQPSQRMAAIRGVIAGVDSAVPAFVTASMPALVAASAAAERYRTTLMHAFALAATALAAMGIFGVTVRAVVEREREIGIRMTLGASAPDIIRLIVARAAAGAAAGLVVGLTAALAASRAIAAFLYDVSATDPATYASTALLLLVTSIVAAWLPARRAAKVEPARVLGDE